MPKLSESDFFRYLELQGSDELLTKTELLEEVRFNGLQVSERNLVYYQTQGLIPPPVRVGGRTGAYPAVVAQLAVWVLRSRQRGLPLDAIRELIPVWQLLVRARRDGVVHLAEIELLARNHVSSTEANYAIPSVVNDVFHNLCLACHESLTWIDKNNEPMDPTDGIVLGFALAEMDENDRPRQVAWTQLRLPGISDALPMDGPATIVLGIPVGVTLPTVVSPRGNLESTIQNDCDPEPRGAELTR